MGSKVQWQLCDVSEAESRAFSSFSSTWDNAGVKLDGNRMSSLVTVNVGPQKYYVKKYEKRGRLLRRLIGRSRRIDRSLVLNHLPSSSTTGVTFPDNHKDSPKHWMRIILAILAFLVPHQRQHRTTVSLGATNLRLVAEFAQRTGGDATVELVK